MTNTHQLVMSLSEPQNILTVQNRKEFRLWLEAYHTTEKECWLKVKRGRPYGDMHFWYIDAVEEALCFGWIDSTIKRINGVVQQRFTPRTKKSTWTELNKERCRRMERLGKMTDAGRAVLPNMSENGFRIDKDILEILQNDDTVWNNFCHFPPLYMRVRINTIQIAKREQTLFERRLSKFIDYTRKNIMYGEWNDNGRLLEE